MSAVYILIVVAVLTAWPAGSALPRSAEPEATEAEQAVLRRARPLLAVGAGVGCYAFFGSFVGTAAGVVAVALVWRTLGAAESPAVKRRRAAIVDDLPVAVDLIAACLEAGTSIPRALDAVAAGLPGPVADELTVIGARLRLGADPVSMWRAVGSSGPLAPLGRAFARSLESGASASQAMALLSAEIRDAAAESIEARARTVEVRAAAPLGACLLPAFMVLGVVPLTAGLFAGLDFLG